MAETDRWSDVSGRLFRPATGQPLAADPVIHDPCAEGLLSVFNCYRPRQCIGLLMARVLPTSPICRQLLDEGGHESPGRR